MAPVHEIETVESIPESTPASIPSQDEIATMAYALWQQRGCPEGSPDVNWLKAEAELMVKLA
jgi:hypothetical protein